MEFRFRKFTVVSKCNGKTKKSSLQNMQKYAALCFCVVQNSNILSFLFRSSWRKKKFTISTFSRILQTETSFQKKRSLEILHNKNAKKSSLYLPVYLFVCLFCLRWQNYICSLYKERYKLHEIIYYKIIRKKLFDSKVRQFKDEVLPGDEEESEDKTEGRRRRKSGISR